MQRTIATELEALAQTLLARAYIARAGLVTDAGEVLWLQRATSDAAPSEAAEAPRATSDEGGASDDEREPLPEDLHAVVLVEAVDDERWLYADVGGVRLLGRLRDAGCEAEAAALVCDALRGLGVAVEEEPARTE